MGRVLQPDGPARDCGGEIAAEVVAKRPHVGGSEAEVSADGPRRREGATVRPAKHRLARDAEKPGGLAGGEEGSISTSAHAHTSIREQRPMPDNRVAQGSV